MCEVQVTATEALRLASAVVRVAWQADRQLLSTWHPEGPIIDGHPSS
jgi:hypothetical protein